MRYNFTLLALIPATVPAAAIRPPAAMLVQRSVQEPVSQTDCSQCESRSSTAAASNCLSDVAGRRHCFCIYDGSPCLEGWSTFLSLEFPYFGDDMFPV